MPDVFFTLALEDSEIQLILNCVRVCGESLDTDGQAWERVSALWELLWDQLREQGFEEADDSPQADS